MDFDSAESFQAVFTLEYVTFVLESFITQSLQKYYVLKKKMN